jgi:hypothetical protein
VDAHRAAEPDAVRAINDRPHGSSLRLWRSRVRDVARGGDHDASCAPVHRRAGSPEEEPTRGASVVGTSGRCRSAPTIATALRASSRVVSALSCSVALVR